MEKEALRIATILKEAVDLSNKYDNISDTGPSNLDVCCITLDKSLINDLSRLSGIDLLIYKNWSCYISIDYKGQGLRRTKKAEFICDYLKGRGLKSCVEYNLD